PRAFFRRREAPLDSLLANAVVRNKTERSRSVTGPEGLSTAGLSMSAFAKLWLATRAFTVFKLHVQHSARQLGRGCAIDKIASRTFEIASVWEVTWTPIKGSPRSRPASPS